MADESVTVAEGRREGWAIVSWLAIERRGMLDGWMDGWMGALRSMMARCRSFDL